MSVKNIGLTPRITGAAGLMSLFKNFAQETLRIRLNKYVQVTVEFSADLKYSMTDTVKVMSQRIINDSKEIFFLCIF